MALHTLVSMESEFVRVITARSRGGNFAVERALTLSREELEDFLAHDRSSAYQIVVNPVDAICETITIPPVKPKLVDALVKSEVDRLYSTLPPFSLTYRAMDETFQDGKTMKRIACCMVPVAALETALRPFVRFNKPVSRVIALPAIFAHLIAQNSPDSEETALCAHDGASVKTIFLLEKGSVTLVRHVPSEAPGWGRIDLQNFSMTMDYCFQSLRVRPTRFLAMNGEGTAPPLTPCETPLHQRHPDLCQDYLPLLAAMEIRTDPEEDLRPAPYGEELGRQLLLGKGMLVFSAASALVALFLIATIFGVISLNSDLATARSQEQHLHATLETNRSARRDLTEIEPLLTLAATMRAEPSLPALLAGITGPPAPPIRLTSLKAVKEKGSLTLSLGGSIAEGAYAGMQADFETLCARTAKASGLPVVTKQLDANARTFTLEAARKP